MYYHHAPCSVYIEKEATLRSVIPRNLQTGIPSTTPWFNIHSTVPAQNSPGNFPKTARKGVHPFTGRCAPNIRFPPPRAVFPLHMCPPCRKTQESAPWTSFGYAWWFFPSKTKGPRNTPRAHDFLSGYFIYLHHQYQATPQLSGLFPYSHG